MASKRDQLQAYQFLVQRAISALVTRETDPEQPPFRRPTGAVLASIALAIVSLACVGVYGMIVPGGNNAWRKDAAVIVEKETGTRYVYLNDRLYPVANYASALLLLGDHRATQQVSRNSLADVPRGPRIGIPGAPDALPGPDRLLTGSWSLCSAPASDVAGSRIEESVLLAGAEPAGGAGLGDQALLVELAPTGERYLIWRGRRHQINAYDAVVGTGLALTSEPWARVGQAWLDVLPEGAPIEPLAVAQAGEPSAAVEGRTDIRVGMLLVVQTSGGGQQYYLAERDALRPITQLQHDIQLADARTMLAAYPGGEPKAVQLAPSLAATARRLDPVVAAAGSAPATRPAVARLRDREATVCATFGQGGAVPLLVVDPVLPPADPMTATTRRSVHGTPLADRVHVPPGWAAVVEAMPSEQAPVGTLTVVTDMGRRYPVAAPEVLRMLGYASARPVRLPAGLVARLPEGPALDPNAAMRQAPAG
ncbi:type VII secretion protein EccB [Saccharopolyspora elongata]|uniref:Type VII secretion protein EccB n=1 Tax=Saccharopolyspora elongata TaxID=2530387 RepID=A0A4R4YZ04_9PSEU|nr:type VII secretion protein EccB [Saccharopolyspora elongata]TDD50781.1 type VII secretion protein EccB [Saccharopolyspora elongata]